MILAGLFAGVLFLGLLIGDWMYFGRLTADAARYGYGLGTLHERFAGVDAQTLTGRFDAEGFLALPHGAARLFPEAKRLVIRPTCRLFSMRFRTAWPLKGSIEWRPDADGLVCVCTKRAPWSSSILTLSWFALVSLGTLAFLVSYVMDGGFATFGGLSLGVGVTAIGLIVVAFGLLTVTVAYRIEDTRLMQVYGEWRAAMLGESGSISETAGTPRAAAGIPAAGSATARSESVPR